MSRAVASRYQPVLVALHWLIALLIIGLLCIGFFVLADWPNSDPKKLDILVLHMSGGMIVLALMLLRVAVRWGSAKPAPAGPPPLDWLAGVTHATLYLIIFGMIASGFVTGYLISSAFAPGGKPLPESFTVLPSFQIHAILATGLAILIVGHIGAALYHQFALKDGLFRRMWFGARTIVREGKPS